MDPISVTSSILLSWFVQHFSVAVHETIKSASKEAGQDVVGAIRRLVVMIRIGSTRNLSLQA